VCAGGGVTGAVYEIGALRAIEDLLDRSVLDFDTYVGVSGGAFVASLLAHGISPGTLYDELLSDSSPLFGAFGSPLFRLAASEILKRTKRTPRVVLESLTRLLKGDTEGPYDFILPLFELLPAGLLDNSGIRDFLHDTFVQHGSADRFDDLSRELFVVAVDLDTGDAVPFGERGHRDIPVSTAVQASTALPGLYRPVRIGHRDYVDGGVKKTAHVNLAIKHGADLIVCINPIVPILNDPQHRPLGEHLSRKGITFVLDQVLRIALHGRMQYGMERYEVEHPDVDILLIEPTRQDMGMFAHNIMRVSARHSVAEYGYRSAMAAFRRNRLPFARRLGRHDIHFRKQPVARRKVGAAHPHFTSLSRRLSESLASLESRLDHRR
jgi:NTE family protein